MHYNQQYIHRAIRIKCYVCSKDIVEAESSCNSQREKCDSRNNETTKLKYKKRPKRKTETHLFRKWKLFFVAQNSVYCGVLCRFNLCLAHPIINGFYQILYIYYLGKWLYTHFNFAIPVESLARWGTKRARKCKRRRKNWEKKEIGGKQCEEEKGI